MFPSVSQFSKRADGMPEAMPPSAFERNTPKFRPGAGAPAPMPVYPKSPKKPAGGLSIPKENNYKPVGSGASAAFGGSLGGGGGPMGRK